MRITPIEVKSERQVEKFMISLGVSPEGARILSPKSRYWTFKLEGIKSWEANIIKQHLLSLGSDAAIERAALIKNIKTTAFIFGNLSQLRKLCQKLENQPFALREISQSLSLYLDNLDKKELVLCAGNKVLKIKKPIICGIVNVTDDSFSGDGMLTISKASDKKLTELVLRKVTGMVKEGAKIIDIGGESSRPFSKRISAAQEAKRVIPIIKILRKKFKNTIISLDTYKYMIAKKGVDCGVDIINDITALRADTKIASLVKKHKLGCILMHMKGRPSTMQINPKYKDVVEEELDFFKERLSFCSTKGISRSQILIDPGIGFGKRLQDNTKILKELYKFKIFGVPIFLGLSRKSFIGKIVNVKVDERLIGTIAASVIAVSKGANILRVHDVAQTAQAFKIVAKISNN